MTVRLPTGCAVTSPLGWPVRADARWADVGEIAGLVEIARSRGYSRKAPGIDLGSDDVRLLLTWARS